MDGLTFSQWKTIRMCEFYSNSRYLGSQSSVTSNGILLDGGNKDELGRDAPFYNIVNYRVTIAKVATDLDVKDMDITSDDPKHYVKTMLLRKELYKWMKESNFSQFLNRFGYTRAKYGGALVKKHEYNDGEGDELEIEVVQWKNAITDQINIADNPIIERHYMTFAEILKKKDTWDNVEEVLQANSNIKTAKKYGQKEISNRICVYEIKGEFPKSYLLDAKDKDHKDEDEYEYTLQEYYIADVYGKNYVLYADDLKESPYKYKSWEEMEGRGLGRGVIEDSEEAQVWINDAVKNEKNAMDLAGKVVLKTTSKKIGNNILEIDNGKIFEIEEGKEFDVMNLTPSALGEFQVQINKWKEQADGATSSYDANTGEQPPSGTPYSQTALLNQIASKPFDYRREEAGIFITEIMNDWVIPFTIKKLKKKHILMSDFDQDELDLIDEDFQNHRANEKVRENLKQGKYTSPEEYQAYKDMEKLVGSKRYLEMPDKYFDDIECYITINPTGELKNKQAILQSLDHIIGQYIQSFNPATGQYGVTNDPYLKKLFDTAIELAGTGVSPASLGKGSQQTGAMAQNTMPMQPTTSVPAPTV